MEQENEKIIYDIEIRVEQAKQALKQLQAELKQNGKEDFLVNLKILGTEKFNSVKQNLNEVKKAIEVLEKHNNTKLTLNGADFDVTLQKLRALEKELEDFQSKVNNGNLNKQLKEQQKLSEVRAKQELNNQMLLAQAEENRQKEKNKKTEQNKKALDNYYKTEEARIKQNSNSHKRAYSEWNKSELEKEKIAEQNKKNLEKFYEDENKRIQENSNRSYQAYQKINEATNRYNNILDSINKKKQLGIQLSEQEYATAQKRLQNAKQKVIDAGGRSVDLPLLQDRNSFNKEAMGNYFGGITSKSLFDMDTVTSYSQKMSKLTQILDSATYAWEKSGRKNSEYRKIMIETQAEIDKTSRTLRRLQESAGQALSTTDKMMLGLRTHATWIASSVLASIPLVLPGYAVNTMKELESKFATVEQVMPEIEHAHMASLDKNLSEMERMAGLKKVTDEMNTFIDIGSKFGVAVDEVIEAGASIGRMYGQGENGVANTNLLTQQASRIAVADNFPIMQATKGLESALSQFELQTDDTNQLLINSNRIIDVWTLAAHRGAASAQDLTEGVQLAGAAAHQAGISFEFLNALIATGVRTTGRSGNEIGNSIKSFVNSMQSDKSIRALQDFGINMYKDNGDGTQSLRSMEDVILDISRMMQTTEKDYSSLLLTLSGGKYQVSKLTAILKDYKELVRMSGLLNSDEANGFTDKQIEIQLNTLIRKLESLGTNIKGLFFDIGNSGVLDTLKGMTDEVNNIVSGVRELNLNWDNWIKGVTALIVAIKGLPFLINGLGKIAGRFQGAKQSYNRGQGYGWSDFKDTLGIHLEDNYNKGVLATGGVLKEKETIDKSTEAKTKNARATNVLTNTITNSTIATKVYTGTTGIATTVTKGFSIALATFGGPIGLAIAGLSTLASVVLMYSDSIGEETNANKQLIDKLQEKASLEEEEYNRKIRSIDNINNLKRNYEALIESLDNYNDNTEKQKEISKDAEATFLVLQEVVKGLSDENNKCTATIDENGKVILKVNGKQVDSFDELKNTVAENREVSLESAKSIIDAEISKTESQIELIQQRIEAMEKEGKQVGALQELYWSFDSWYHSWRANQLKEQANDLEEQEKSGFVTPSSWYRGGGTSPSDLRKMASDEEEKANYNKIYGSSTKELSDILTKLKTNVEESKKRSEEIANQIADTRKQINENKYNTGGADSNRGNLIAEPPEEKQKGKSKAEKEAEKLARQQEAYNKAMQKATMSAVMTAENYSERPTNYILNGSFGVGTATDDATSERATYVVNEFLKKGYNLVQATGILGNFIQESSLNTSIESQDGQESYGLGQWTAERRKALIDYANERQLDANDINVQIDFTDHEIKNGQIMTRQGVDWNNRFMNATTPEEASYAFGKGFERPNDYYADWKNRQTKARQAYDYHNNGNNVYTTKSDTSLGNDAGLVYNVLKNIGMDNEKLNLLGNDIPSIIKTLDSMGANLSFANATPTTGDILYTQDGKAFVVNGEGYIGVNGTKGDNWKDISNLSDIYTSKQYAMGLTLENAKEKGNRIKVSDEAQMFNDYVINKDENTRQKRLEDYDEKIKYFDRLNKEISNRRSIYGEYDFETINKEYSSLKEKLDVETVNAGLIRDMQSEYKQAIDEQFNKGVLKQKLTENGFNNWKELSDKTLDELVNSYSNATGNKELQSWINAYKTLSERADEATIKVEEATLALKQAQGIKTPEQQLEDNLKNIERQTALWKSNYAQMYGSYDGIEWQSNKREHSDTLEQIKLYREELARLNIEREKYIKSGIDDKAYFEKLSNTITETQTKLNEAVKKAEETGGDLTKANKETIAGMLHDLIKGGSSFKEVWTNIWNDIANVALKRLMGIQDATSEWWNVISNVLGFGRNKLNIAEEKEAGQAVDKYNIDNNTTGKYASGSMSMSERIKYQNSTEGVIDFYSNNDSVMQSAKITEEASKTNLLASQLGEANAQTNLITSKTDEAVSLTNQAVSATDEATSTTDISTASIIASASAEMLSAAMLMQSASMNMSFTGGSSGGIFSWAFAKGGYIPKFVKGGNTITNGGKIKGAGTGTSDSILAYLADHDKFIGVSNGEYIMNARATRKYGNILEQMNLDKFATGGSIAPEPYIPTLKNPNIANNIIKQEVQKQNNNARMEELLGQQNLILTNIAKQDGSSGGNITILNTRATKEEIYSELAKDPRALQRLLYGNQKRGFR